MANRHKRATSAPHLEHEIERCRELEYWSKVEDLAKKLKTRDDPNSAQFTTLGNFLTGEAKLEQYLHDHPPLRSKGKTRTLMITTWSIHVPSNPKRYSRGQGGPA
jgi:hypothetical protein